MADNDFRAYSGRGDANANDFASDPLAELARLIGQSDPNADLHRPRPSSAELLDHAAMAAPEFDAVADTHHGEPERYEEAQYAEPPLVPAQHGEGAYSEHYDDDAAQQTLRSEYSADHIDDGAAGDDTHYDAAYSDAEAAETSRGHRLPALPPQDTEGGYDADGYWQDHADGQPEMAEEYYDEPVGARGPSTVITALAVVGLVVIGSGSAFAYRHVFGARFFPSLPPIIMASGGPNKIVPPSQSAAANSSASTSTAPEKLVSREEQPVPVQPTNPPPRVVSTIPIMPATSMPAPVAPAVVTPPQPFIAAPPALLPTAAPLPPPAAAATEPKKVHTVAIHAEPPGSAAAAHPRLPPAPARPAPAQASRPGGDGPLSLVPAAEGGAPARTQVARATEAPSAEPASVASTGGYAVQLTSQRSEAEARAAYRSLKAKFPAELGSREPMIRRADLGPKGTFYRALVGPFGSAEAAAEACSKLKAAGGSCIVQRN